MQLYNYSYVDCLIFWLRFLLLCFVRIITFYLSCFILFYFSDTFYFLDEKQDFRRSVISDTIMRDFQLNFLDVAGLLEAKQALQEAIIMPLQYPHLFTGNEIFHACLCYMYCEVVLTITYY